MIPLLLAAAGAIALVAAAAVLRSYGPRYRVGRLLASTPRVSVTDALQIARARRPRYVRVEGRIDSEEEFEDVHHRPLVLRRTRFEALERDRWVGFEDSREVVRFRVNEGLDSIDIDGPALSDGLVVVRRESEGAAGDLGERAPTGLAPETRVRAVVEQVSSVDHAIVLGVPTLTVGVGDGDEPERIHLTAGLGRPLILTTLEPDEAMRVIAGGSTRPRLAAACFVAGAALVGLAVVWAGISALMPAVVPAALAASPTAESTPATGGDPRSSGEGPGLVGEPGLAILAVVAIAILAVLVTTAYVRWTSSRSEPPASRR